MKKEVARIVRTRTAHHENDEKTSIVRHPKIAIRLTNASVFRDAMPNQ